MQSSINNLTLSIVLSFYNECEVLPEFVHRTRKILNLLKKDRKINGHEFIFVNDASTDDSEKLLVKLDKWMISQK